jgi:hypothetical protein
MNMKTNLAELIKTYGTALAGSAILMAAILLAGCAATDGVRIFLGDHGGVACPTGCAYSSPSTSPTIDRCKYLDHKIHFDCSFNGTKLSCPSQEDNISRRGEESCLIYSHGGALQNESYFEWATPPEDTKYTLVKHADDEKIAYCTMFARINGYEDMNCLPATWSEEMAEAAIKNVYCKETPPTSDVGNIAIDVLADWQMHCASLNSTPHIGNYPNCIAEPETQPASDLRNACKTEKAENSQLLVGEKKNMSACAALNEIASENTTEKYPYVYKFEAFNSTHNSLWYHGVFCQFIEKDRQLWSDEIDTLCEPAEAENTTALKNTSCFPLLIQPAIKAQEISCETENCSTIHPSVPTFYQTPPSKQFPAYYWHGEYCLQRQIIYYDEPNELVGDARINWIAVVNMTPFLVSPDLCPMALDCYSVPNLFEGKLQLRIKNSSNAPGSVDLIEIDKNSSPVADGFTLKTKYLGAYVVPFVANFSLPTLCTRYKPGEYSLTPTCSGTWTPYDCNLNESTDARTVVRCLECVPPVHCGSDVSSFFIVDSHSSCHPIDRYQANGLLWQKCGFDEAGHFKQLECGGAACFTCVGSDSDG